MQSTAKDVTAYLEEVPAERKAALRKCFLSAIHPRHLHSLAGRCLG